MKNETTAPKPGKATHYARVYELKDGKTQCSLDLRKVRVMAVAEGYAMVRRKGAMPYVCSIKEIAQAP